MSPVPILLASVCALGLGAGAARAESFAPVGLWRGETSGDFLLVWGEGFCSLAGSLTAAGRCTWTACDHAGILTLTPDAAPHAAVLDLKVRWLSGDTIIVAGPLARSSADERFRRSG